MWVGAALSVLSIAVTFLGVEDIREQVVEQADNSLSADERDRAVSLTLTVVGLLGLLTAAVWLWMAIANAEGRRWARRTATALGIAYVVSATVRFVAQDEPWPQLALAAVTVALVVAILALLYRTDASRYFDDMSSPPGYPG
jgi:peptidoglycan/LPS O-acetylase OafA/YrhL